ncbi:unnamed protein product, partial [Prunus brigantina]
TGPPPSFHPDQSQPLEPPVVAGKCKNPTGFNPKFTELVLPPSATVLLGSYRIRRIVKRRLGYSGNANPRARVEMLGKCSIYRGDSAEFPAESLVPRLLLKKEATFLRSEPGMGVMPGSPQGSSRFL